MKPSSIHDHCAIQRPASERSLNLLKVLLVWAMSLCCITVFAVDPPPQKNKPVAPPPPLTRDQVLDMVGSDLNSVDILVEAKSRGLSFIVDARTLEDLTDRGADPLLLNWLGLYSLELNPLYLRCVSEKDQKRHGRVVEVSTELLNKSPRLLHIYQIRGSAYRAQDKLEEAIADFRQAIEFHPNSSRARILLAESLISQGNYDEAIAGLTWVVEHKSPSGIQDWPTAHRLLAEAYIRQRKYRQASDELHTALWQLPFPNPESIALLPPLEDHLSVLARLLSLCPDPQIASPADAVEIANLMKLMATNNDQQQLALLRLAEGQAASGQFDEAVATQKAAEIISAGIPPDSIRERLALYQDHKLPLLPEGNKTGETARDPVPQVNPQAALPKVILERMKPIGGSTEDPKSNSVPNKKPHSFMMGRFEVTRGEWAAVMGLPEPWFPHLPMDCVSWDDCQSFLKKLNELTAKSGQTYRLPTLEEWQYAAEGSPAGEAQSAVETAALASYGWSRENSQQKLHAGGMLRENGFGLVDLNGNVAEWCQDEVAPTSNGGSPKEEKPGPTGYRAVLGGSYLSSAENCRAQVVGVARQNEVRRGLGLRLVLDKTDANAAPDGTNEKPSDEVVVNRPTTSGERSGLTLAIKKARHTLETEIFQRAWLQEKLFSLLYFQACVRANLNDVQVATDNLRALIREMPSDDSAMMHLTRCHLAWILANQESATPEQIAEAKQIVETSLSRSEFRLWIGYLTQSSVLAAEGNYEDADRRATQALDLAPLQFKEICQKHLQAVQQKKRFATQLFPISLAIPPHVVIPL